MVWLFIGGGCLLAGYLLFVFPTQWLKIERVRHPLGLGIRILQISDLHVERLRVSPARLNALILRETPDIIVLTGDYTERGDCLPRVKRYAEAIRATGVPAYAVLGNHDYRLSKAGLRQLIRCFEDCRIRVLRNESVEIPGFQLIGIDDFGSGMSKLASAFGGSNPLKPSILITHDPNVVLQLQRSYDYFMAGHLHGKQFRLPFLYQLKAKGPLAERGIYKGLHRTPQGPFYISKGIGQAGINARFLVRSEVTLHDL